MAEMIAFEVDSLSSELNALEEKLKVFILQFFLLYSITYVNWLLAQMHDLLFGCSSSI